MILFLLATFPLLLPVVALLHVVAETIAVAITSESRLLSQGIVLSLGIVEKKKDWHPEIPSPSPFDRLRASSRIKALLH